MSLEKDFFEPDMKWVEIVDQIVCKNFFIVIYMPADGWRMGIRVVFYDRRKRNRRNQRKMREH